MNDARYALANLYLSDKRYAKASAEFERMWSSNPPDTRGFSRITDRETSARKNG
jgi:cytochrome c-type biogenesis protein CcmH/NrfG